VFNGQFQLSLSRAMSPAPFRAVGIDVGGTKTAIAIIEFPEGRIVSEKSIPTRPDREATAVLEDIAQLAETLVAESRLAGNGVAGVGVGVCELVAPDGEVLSHNCLVWEKALVQERLVHLAPVTVEADVRAAALAESLFGAGKSFRLFLYITVGTGIACCLMQEGRPYVGTRGATGTMASSVLSQVCERCGHVNNLSLEQVASGPALVERYNESCSGNAASGQDVLAAAAAGNVNALRVVETAGEALGSTVGLLVNVLDPAAVIVGGGLGFSGGPFWSNFIASTRRHIWSEVHRGLPILRAATGLHAGVIGAAAAAWKAHASSPESNQT
jgi:glucokinase